ncbi:unnamed protein product [Chilo suppressalis]|uniref:CCHamide 1 splicing variant a n=1 Tax=Chilo suppressalis TaxID=168631 RepID=A0A0S1U0P0_CHISP|nr:CCHamide 1 precursor splicing variant a [Chilo suppressalis]RVE50191.1 hypothetical protein evm_005214 [Chilo suppressalis]CAH0399048.1 unnamed protein product [Chilo suppressalis]
MFERTESTTKKSMDKSGATRSRGPGVTATFVALLLILCLAESATEQRINSRGSKSSLVEKINGWRSQRGGSCLSYGHSCWGAHGKRSGRPPITATDWYLNRMLRRIASSSELDNASQLRTKNDDLSAIYQVETPDNSLAANGKLISENEDIPMEMPSRTMEAKPMLDDELLSKVKLWQIMREASVDN